MTRRFSPYALAAFLACLPVTARAACQMSRIVEMPVTMDQLVPMVSGQVNGKDAHFIADSGAYYSLITHIAAKRFDSPLKSTQIYTGGVGGWEKMGVTRAKDLTLLGHTYHDVDFMVGGDAAFGYWVDGLLGQNFFRAADAEFDLADGAIRLFKEDGCEHTAPTYWTGGKLDGVNMIRIADTDAAESHITGEAYVNGHKIRVMFDTGAGTSILTRIAGERLGLKPDMAGAEPGGEASGIGRGSAQSWIVPVDSFQVGGEQIKNTKLRIAEVGLGGVDMLIGADFFLSHRVYVAYRRRELYFTYNGGPVFNLTHQASNGPAVPSAAAPPAGKEPQDASGFARRGAASLARKQYEAALADYDKAVALEPASPEHPFQRAQVYAAMEKPDLARADLDRALKLKPDHRLALMLRARLLLEHHDLAAARSDLDAALKLSDNPNEGLEIAQLYSDQDAFEDAVASFDRWLAANRDKPLEAYALSGRCWARVLWNHELDKAMEDCNRAVSINPYAVDIRDSRGMGWLRMNQPARAMDDYGFAMRRGWKSAWALYGRGVAESRRGDAAKAQADIAAAGALDPKVPDRARRLGIAP